MDVDFWAARSHSAKHFTSARLKSSGNGRMMMEDEGSEKLRAWFPCPFCYVEIEVPLLCVHLQEEHCFGLKNAVCPICAANLGRDPISHFTMQHAQSIKRGKNSQKSSFWSDASTNIVRDLRELSSCLGTNSPAGVCSGNEPAPDPLLSSFVCPVPLTIPEDGQKKVSQFAAAISDQESNGPSPRDEAEEQDHEERRQRAAFVQELLFSTIF